MLVEMEVRAFLNAGPGMFWRYAPGDALKPGPVVRLALDDAARPDPLLGSVSLPPEALEHAALDRAWAVGNRMGADDAGAEWPSDVRSLSVGDVLAIGEAAWSVAMFGFEALPPGALAASLDPDLRAVRDGFDPATLEWAGA